MESREELRPPTDETPTEPRDFPPLRRNSYVKKPKSEKQSEGFYVRLTADEARQIRKIAKNAKVSIGETIRAALRDFYLL